MSLTFIGGVPNWSVNMVWDLDHYVWDNQTLVQPGLKTFQKQPWMDSQKKQAEVLVKALNMLPDWHTIKASELESLTDPTDVKWKHVHDLYNEQLRYCSRPCVLDGDCHFAYAAMKLFKPSEQYEGLDDDVSALIQTNNGRTKPMLVFKCWKIFDKDSTPRETEAKSFNTDNGWTYQWAIEGTIDFDMVASHVWTKTPDAVCPHCTFIRGIPVWGSRRLIDDWSYSSYAWEKKTFHEGNREGLYVLMNPIDLVDYTKAYYKRQFGNPTALDVKDADELRFRASGITSDVWNKLFIAHAQLKEDCKTRCQNYAGCKYAWATSKYITQDDINNKDNTFEDDIYQHMKLYDHSLVFKCYGNSVNQPTSINKEYKVEGTPQFKVNEANYKDGDLDVATSYVWKNPNPSAPKLDGCLEAVKSLNASTGALDRALPLINAVIDDATP